MLGVGEYFAELHFPLEALLFTTQQTLERSNAANKWSGRAFLSCNADDGGESNARLRTKLED
jgi:hypothetical protein